MKHRLFTTSEKAWEAMQIAIAEAKTSVYLEMYIVSDDTSGHNFLRALEEASKRGVHVVAILDLFGSFTLDSDIVLRLRNAGAEVLFASFFFQRMHRKVLIIDESVAFVGGVNVGKSYARWKDLQVEIRGPVVETVLRSFARSYRNCGGKGLLAKIELKAGPIRKAKMWFIDHGIGVRRAQLRKHYMERLRNAKKSIVLVTPYLLPPRWLYAELHQALIRGVSVEILLPGSTDHKFVDGVNETFAATIAELGAQCYFMRGMNHAKVMMVDGAEGTIGSQNLDFLSFNWNIEAGVFFHEPEMVRDVLGIIEEWKKGATIVRKENVRFRWYHFPIAFFLRLFGFLPLW